MRTLCLLREPHRSNAFSGFSAAWAVAVKEVSWDYAPSGYNNLSNTTLGSGSMPDGMNGMAAMQQMPMSGSAMSNMSMTNMSMNSSDTMFYTKFKKAQYFEFTDATFTTVKATPEWQGNLGPTLRAEVQPTPSVWNT
jgi:hypothetical protein